MADKLTERLDLPKCIRIDPLLRAKLNVVRDLRGRNLAQQIREAIFRGLHQEFAELGKEGLDRLFRELSEVLPRLPISAPLPPRLAESCRQTAVKAGPGKAQGIA